MNVEVAVSGWAWDSAISAGISSCTHLPFWFKNLWAPSGMGLTDAIEEE